MTIWYRCDFTDGFTTCVRVVDSWKLCDLIREHGRIVKQLKYKL